MARPLRLNVPGGIFHVTARGNGRQPVFVDDSDRREFIALAAKVKSRFGWRFLTYCLMGNHYHLVVRTPEPNLSLGARQLNGPYAQGFNRRHTRVGPVFAGRFKAVLVEADRHLLELARYVVLNPVRAGICARPEDWRWSAHRALLGPAQDPLLTNRELLGYFGRTVREGRKRYARFVSESHSPPADAGRAIVGSAEFAAAHLPDGSVDREIPRRQLLGPPVGLSELLAGDDREASVAHAYLDHGFSMREIAAVLGCHYTTVSRILRRFESRELGEPRRDAPCKT